MASRLKLSIIYMPVQRQAQFWVLMIVHHGRMGTLGSFCNILKFYLMVSNFADEILAVDSLKASSVKDSSSPFFCHHLLPLPPSLVFLSPSLLSFTVRKDYLWRDNSVPSCTRKDGGPQTLLQWVTLTAGGNWKDKIWVLVFLDAAALSWAAHASAKCLWIYGPRTWTYLPKISAVSLVCASRALPSPAPGAFLFALCIYHMGDMGAWTMRAEKGSVAFVMAYQYFWASGAVV